MKKISLIAAVCGALLFAACGDEDTTSDRRDTGSAKATINMPNHFNNVAHKCYEQNGVYVSDHGDGSNPNSGGGDVFVLANDPACGGVTP